MYVGVSQSPRGGEPRGVLVCVDGNSHKVRWEYRAAGPVESTPVIGDDDTDLLRRQHGHDPRGQLSTAAASGRPRSARRSARPARSSRPQRVAFGLDNETLMVLECSAPAAWPRRAGRRSAAPSAKAAWRDPAAAIVREKPPHAVWGLYGNAVISVRVFCV